MSSRNANWRRLWVALGLVGLLVLGAFVTTGLIGATGSDAGDSDGAESSDERVARFNGAFPIPNASGVGIQETAVIDPTNETVYVFGAASCTAGEILEVQVTLTQNSTGAAATGDTAAYCLGPDFVQSWIVTVDDASGFEAGDARVDAWARTQRDGETTDTIRWGRPVTVAASYPDRASLGAQTATPGGTATSTTNETTTGTTDGDNH